MLAKFSARLSQHRFGVPRYCIRRLLFGLIFMTRFEWLVMQRLRAFGCAMHPM